MDELKGEDIVFVRHHHESIVVLTGSKGNWQRHFLSWEKLRDILQKQDYFVKKKRVRTHIIDVIR